MVQLGNSSGAVTNTYVYDSFGNEKNIDSNDTNPMRYCGEYYGKETGTIYLRARYYDAGIGRFISEDSVRGKANDPLSLNLYTYCSNNPVMYLDPTGHEYGRVVDFVESYAKTFGTKTEIERHNDEGYCLITVGNHEKVRFNYKDFNIDNGRMMMDRKDFLNHMGISFESEVINYTITKVDKGIIIACNVAQIFIPGVQEIKLTTVLSKLAGLGFRTFRSKDDLMAQEGKYQMERIQANITRTWLWNITVSTDTILQPDGTVDVKTTIVSQVD